MNNQASNSIHSETIDQVQHFLSYDTHLVLTSSSPHDSQQNPAQLILASGDWNDAKALLDRIPTKGIPLTVLTGFLGAGKTTLLNFILSQNHGYRIAVLVNELGDIDIDSQLLDMEATTQEDRVIRPNQPIELKNGCICCTISNSFIDAIQNILNRQDIKPPDYIVVETTGVADPVPIIETIENTELDDQLYVDQVLTVVDAYHYFTKEYQLNVCTSQIQNADTILLSKVDLVSQDTTDKVIQALINERANLRILKSAFGKIPVKLLFDLDFRGPRHHQHQHNQDKRQQHEQQQHLKQQRLLSSQDTPNRIPKSECTATTTKKCNVDADDPGGWSCCSKTQSTHLEQDGFQALSFSTNKPFDLKKFRSHFLKNLPSQVYRSKGLLWFNGYPLRFVFQLSGRRFQIEQDSWPLDIPKTNQLVVIGRNIDVQVIRQMLNECLSDDVIKEASYTIIS